MKLAALVLAASAATASAHHSLAGTYDLKREVTLKGRIVQLLLRNPHSFLQIEVPGQDGRIERWLLEFPSGAKTLTKQGIQPGTLKVGDQISLTMNPPNRPGETRGVVVTLHRASDGFNWSAKAPRKQT